MICFECRRSRQAKGQEIWTQSHHGDGFVRHSEGSHAGVLCYGSPVM